MRVRFGHPPIWKDSATPTIAVLATLVAVGMLVSSVGAQVTRTVEPSTPFQKLTDGAAEVPPIAVAVPQGTNTSAELEPGGQTIATIVVGSSPQDISYDGSIDDMLVVNFFSDNLSVISGTSVQTSVDVGSGPYGVAYDPSDGYTYVADWVSDNLTVLSGSSTVGSITGLGNGPFGVLFDPGDSYVYVTNFYSANVSIVSGLKVIATLSTGATPQRLAYDSANGYVYLTNYGSDNVTVISGTAVIGSISVGDSPQGIAYDSGTERIYVANGGSNNLSIISGLKEVGSVAVGTDPYGVAYDAGNGLIYAANYGSDNISAISGSTVVASISVSSYPYQVSFDPADGYLYVSSSTTNYVWVIEPTPSLAVTASATPVYPTTDSPVSFEIDFSGSATGGIGPYSYLWNFGDGQSSTVENPVHQYSSLGVYKAKLTVTDSVGQVVTSHELPVNISAPIGLENVVTAHSTVYTDMGGSCTSVYLLSDCYTIQQNYYLSNSSSPDGLEYGVQNAIVNGTGVLGNEAFAMEQIYQGQYGVAKEVEDYVSTLNPSDGVFHMTSKIVSNQLVVTDSWDGFTYISPNFQLPGGSVSYLYAPSTLCPPSESFSAPTYEYPPVLQIVGPPAGGNVYFTSADGAAKSSLDMGPGTHWTSNLNQTPVPLQSSKNGCPRGSPVQELGFNLTWRATSGSSAASFMFDEGALDQGVAFSVRAPREAPIAITSNSTSAGNVTLDQSFATRLSLVASGTGLKWGSQVSLLGEDFSSRPLDVTGFGLSSPAFFEVQLFGVKSGTTAIGVAVPHSSKASQLEYWTGTSWAALSGVQRIGNEVWGTIPIAAVSGKLPVLIVLGT